VSNADNILFLNFRKRNMNILFLRHSSKNRSLVVKIKAYETRLFKSHTLHLDLYSDAKCSKKPFIGSRLRGSVQNIKDKPIQMGLRDVKPQR